MGKQADIFQKVIGQINLALWLWGDEYPHQSPILCVSENTENLLMQHEDFEVSLNDGGYRYRVCPVIVTDQLDDFFIVPQDRIFPIPFDELEDSHE